MGNKNSREIDIVKILNSKNSGERLERFNSGSGNKQS